MKEGISLLNAIESVTALMDMEVRNLFSQYQKMIVSLERVVDEKNDFKLFDLGERKNLEHAILTTKILRELTSTSLLKKKGDMQIANTHNVKAAIKKASEAKTALA